MSANQQQIAKRREEHLFFEFIATVVLSPLSELLFVDCDTVDTGIFGPGLGGLMDNGIAFVRKNAMCTGVFMDNDFVFAEICKQVGCASDTVDMCPEQFMTSDVFQTFLSPCQGQLADDTVRNVLMRVVLVDPHFRRVHKKEEGFFPRSSSSQ